MPEAGARRSSYRCLSWERHPLRWLLLAFLACELVAAVWLLWRARQAWMAGEPGLAGWVAVTLAAVAAASPCWWRGWRAAGCRYAGIRPGDAAVEVVIGLPDGADVPARVVACWRVGDVAAVLRLAAVGTMPAALPGLLVVPARAGDGEEGTERRALLRALHATSGSP